MAKKKIIVVGAGPGGLTAGMILAHRGFEVEIFEKADRVGGRNAELNAGPYSFDLGPTFLMMKFILDQMFEETGRSSERYLKFIRLDPMYRLIFDGFTLDITQNRQKLKEDIMRLFPEQDPAGFDRFMEEEGLRFSRIYACLQRDYTSFSRYFSKIIIQALPYVPWGKSVMDVLAGYFKPEKLRLAFSFQAKYLGMSPWDCPGIFTMLPYIEHKWGVYHVEGGLCKISEAMAKVVGEEGGKIHLNRPVRQVIVQNGKAAGVELENGEKHYADTVILNADFAHAMTHLMPPGSLKNYTPENLAKRDYSCSTFMLYLGVDKLYEEMLHHTIVFSQNYKEFVDDIFKKKKLNSDLSFYIRNSSVNDPQVAPPGHSNIYVLVPVPNNQGKIDWSREKEAFKEMVLDAIESRTSMKDLRSHIKEARVVTPEDWEKGANVYLGATFNLAHTMDQMLYFRPHNRFEEVGNLFLTGGGTHPGSGLPTIYESGRISANLICDDFGVPHRQEIPLQETAREAL